MKQWNSSLCLAWIATLAVLPAGGPLHPAAAQTPARTPLYDGEIVKIWSVEKNKGTKDKVTIVDIKLEGGNVDFEEIRIRFDAATGAAEHAWWKTKGNFPLTLPKGGLQLKNMPPLRGDVAVTFDREIPEEAAGAAGTAGMSLLTVVSQKPPAAVPIN